MTSSLGPEDGSSADPDPAKMASWWKRRPPGPVTLGGVVLLLAFGVTAFAINTSTSNNPRGLTGTEQLLYGFIVTGLGVLGSVFIGEHYFRKQGAREYQQLAQPALRRVLALHESVLAINSYMIDRLERLDAKPKPEVVREWLEGSVAMLDLHAGQLRASVIDWRQLLPSDYEDLQDTLRLKSEQTALAERVAALNAALDLKTDKEQDARRDMARQLALVNAELDRVNRELAKKQDNPFGSPMIVGRSLTLGSVSSGLSTVSASLGGLTFTPTIGGTTKATDPE